MYDLEAVFAMCFFGVYPRIVDIDLGAIGFQLSFDVDDLRVAKISSP
jgi:hypothetical protein